MNPRRPALLLSLLAVLAVLAAGCGSVSPYAAIVEGTRISQDDVEDELDSIARNERYLQSIQARGPVLGQGEGTFDASFTAQVLTRRIFYVLIERELRSRKVEVTDRDLDLARKIVIEQLGGEDVLQDFPSGYRDTVVRRTATVNVLAMALSGQSSDDAAARAYYDSHQGEFAEACVSHILVQTQEKAEEIRGRLASGEDFGAVARTESIDSTSGARNGELACNVTSETQYVPNFLQAVMTQPVGEVGPPIQTQFGFHLVKVTSRAVPPFEQVADRVRTEMVSNAEATVFNDFIRRVGKEAKISVDPKYGTWNKDRPGVDAPGAPTTVPAVPASPAATVPAGPPTTQP